MNPAPIRDIRIGMEVTVLDSKNGDKSWRGDKMVVTSYSLPFVYVKHPQFEEICLDTQNYTLIELNRNMSKETKQLAKAKELRVQSEELLNTAQKLEDLHVEEVHTPKCGDVYKTSDGLLVILSGKDQANRQYSSTQPHIWINDTSGWDWWNKECTFLGTFSEVFMKRPTEPQEKTWTQSEIEEKLRRMKDTCGDGVEDEAGFCIGDPIEFLVYLLNDRNCDGSPV